MSGENTRARLVHAQSEKCWGIPLGVLHVLGEFVYGIVESQVIPSNKWLQGFDYFRKNTKWLKEKREREKERKKHENKIHKPTIRDQLNGPRQMYGIWTIFGLTDSDEHSCHQTQWFAGDFEFLVRVCS